MRVAPAAPADRRDFPARTRGGCTSTARCRCSSAASNSPRAASSTAKLLCASARSGKSSMSCCSKTSARALSPRSCSIQAWVKRSLASWMVAQSSFQSFKRLCRAAGVPVRLRLLQCVGPGWRYEGCEEQENGGAHGGRVGVSGRRWSRPARSASIYFNAILGMARSAESALRSYPPNARGRTRWVCRSAPQTSLP